jgi:hypothetical protein
MPVDLLRWSNFCKKNVWRWRRACDLKFTMLMTTAPLHCVVQVRTLIV